MNYIYILYPDKYKIYKKIIKNNILKKDYPFLKNREINQGNFISFIKLIKNLLSFIFC